MRSDDPGRSGDRSTGPDGLLLPVPRFDHLRHLTTPLGVWEHAEFTSPRVAHGFCTDDNARALIVACRAAAADAPLLHDISATYLGFLLDARTAAGTFHNRRGHDGTWLDDVGSDDSQGRAWWALGTVARHGPRSWMRDAGVAAFDACATFESVHLRANAFAILGAAELCLAEPSHTRAEELLRRCVRPLADTARSRVPWVEARLTYDNARIPEALLAAGAALHDAGLVRIGLRLLTWLVAVETRGDHFSFVPSGGCVPGDARPAFDQQPVEAAAMVDACNRAFALTGDPAWRLQAVRAAQWLVGHNDTKVMLYDAATGGTSDGLMRDGVNENQGAESTLAGLAALQVAATLADVRPLDVR